MIEENCQKNEFESEPIKRSGCFRYFVIGCLGISIISAGLLVATGIYFVKKIKSFREVKIVQELWDNSEYVSQLRNLELVERKTVELINKTETPVYNIPWWGPVEPSTAKYEVRFNVNYVYYVSADRDKWKFELRDGICYLTAPPLEVRASVLTDTIEGRVDKGWLVLRKSGKLKDIEKSASIVASSRALDNHHLSIVREQCRKSLEDFMLNWFVRNNSTVKVLKIKFADESDSNLPGKHPEGF